MRGNPGTSGQLTIVRPGRDRPFDVTITARSSNSPGEVGDPGRRRHPQRQHLHRRHHRARPKRRDGDRQATGGHPLGYVLDLRSNPGGLLDQAVGVADLFLERGEIVSQRGRRRRPTSSVIMPGQATSRTACRSSFWSMPAPPRPRRSSPARCRTTAARWSWASAASARARSRPSSRSARHRAAADHGALLHAVGPLGAGRRHRARTSSCRSSPIRITRTAQVVREADLRRHLINEIGVQDKLIQNDGRPDPRFAAAAAAREAGHQGLSALLRAADDLAAGLAGHDRVGGAGQEAALGRPMSDTVAESGPIRSASGQRRARLMRCCCRWRCSAGRSARNISAAFSRARCAAGSVGPWRGDRACGCSPSPRRRHRRARARWSGSPRWRSRSGRDRLLSCRRRANIFPGFTQCTATGKGAQTDDFLKRSARAAGSLRRDPGRFLGISMAGWNAILSLGGALLILS